jgi:nucleoside-diphosphate-sugar epimerase
MKCVLVTGSAGLIGSEAARHYNSKADCVIGIDNNMRANFSVLMAIQTGSVRSSKPIVRIIGIPALIFGIAAVLIASLRRLVQRLLSIARRNPATTLPQQFRSMISK